MVRVLDLTGRRRRLALFVGVTTALLITLIFAVPAYAVLTGSPSNFESNDGNMIVNGGAGFNDWASVSFTHVTDVASSQSDDSFVSGQKQDTVCPDTYLHGNPPKDDFTDVASFSEVNSTSGDTYLYGATIRYAANGNASENVELKQGTNGFCTGSTLLARSAGDKLLAIDYLNGGTNVDFHVLTWIDSGTCFVANDTAPCWGATVLTLSGAGAEGLASQAAIIAANNPINGANLAAGQFAEFGVNLATAGIIPTGTCKAFPQTVWESRSSGSSFVSTTKDVSIENKTITNCGEVIIKKHTDPRGINQSFSFTSDLSGSQLTCTQSTATAFSLNDSGNTSGDSTGNTQDCTNVPAGSYHVTEGSNPTGFAYDHLSCTATGTGSSGSQDGTIAKQADITVAAGGVVTCTYINKQQLGAIKVTKTSSKAAATALSGAHFEICTNNGPYTAQNPCSPAKTGSDDLTTGSDGTVCLDNLGFADYYVTEKSAPTGYAVDDTTTHKVTVDNNAACSDATFVGEPISFTDTPLTDVKVTATSEVSGGTKSHIKCVDSGNNTVGESAAGNVDPAEADANGLKPGTYTCTVVIDP